MKIGIDYREAINENRAGKGTVVFEVVNRWWEISMDDEIWLVTDRDFDLTGFPKNFHKMVLSNWGKFWHLRVIWEVWFNFDRYLSLTSYIVPWLSFSDKCILMVHDLVSFHEEYSRKHNVKAKTFEKMSLKGAVNNSRAVIVPSECTKRDLIDIVGAEKSKIKLIYEGVNIFQGMVDVERVKNSFGIEGEYIYFVGTLEPRKNLKKLLLAFSELKLDIHWEGKLVISGGKGWYYQELFELVEEYGITGEVIFTGYVDDEEKFSLLKGAKCFYFVSLYEGFGLPILEAMQMGVPVITSNVSSMPEIAGKAALLVSPDSVAQIKGGLRELITNEEFASGLVSKGYKRVEEFDWQRSAKQIYEIVKS